MSQQRSTFPLAYLSFKYLYSFENTVLIGLMQRRIPSGIELILKKNDCRLKRCETDV